jgi:chemotaxis protein MotB
MDQRRFAAVVGSMRDAFGTQRIHPGQIEALSDSIVQLSKEESTPFLRVIEMPTRGATEREQALMARLRMTLHAQRLERVVEVENTPRGVVMRVPGRMLFDAGSAELRPESLVFLHEVAQVVRSMPGEVAIEGHTDDTPAGDATSNWQLSAERAIAALRYMTEVGGVDPARLRATGFGDTRPRVPNYGPDERLKNRRVEFLFLRPAAEPSPQTAARTGDAPSPQTAARTSDAPSPQTATGTDGDPAPRQEVPPRISP